MRLHTRLLVGAALSVAVATSASAGQLPAPPPPPVIILPTNVVSSLGQYLGTRPYAKVAPLMNALQACVHAQLPDAKGQLPTTSDCPAVTAELAIMHPHPVPASVRPAMEPHVVPPIVHPPLHHAPMKPSSKSSVHGAK